MSPPHLILSIETKQGGQDQRSLQGHWRAIPACSGLLANGISVAKQLGSLRVRLMPSLAGLEGAAELSWGFIEMDVFLQTLGFHSLEKSLSLDVGCSY